jgi:Flp pilus assembly pilin Flp
VKALFNHTSHYLRLLARNESGAEILEWAMIVGLVVIAAVVTVAAFGTKVLVRWTSVNGSM